jgi:hypothetical protein
MIPLLWPHRRAAGSWAPRLSTSPRARVLGYFWKLINCRISVYLPSLSSLIAVLAQAERRSEGKELISAATGKSRGSFLSEFILAYMAPGERFSFFAIKPTFIPDRTNWRN